MQGGTTDTGTGDLLMLRKAMSGCSGKLCIIDARQMSHTHSDLTEIMEKTNFDRKVLPLNLASKTKIGYS